LTQNDPTDHALATIASILEHSESAREPENIAVDETPGSRDAAEGYSRTGPGPITAIRFKWSIRRGQNGEYYVDETIGDSVPVSSPPMSADAAIRLVNDRESEAQRRFEQLKSEMAGRAAAANLARKDNSEF
jgi:hypothetical protein